MRKVRPFHRDDRDQLTDLVNAHVAAVVPGVSVSVNTVLSQLTGQPDEFITDPWVADRVTLVAEQRQYVVAAGFVELDTSLARPERRSRGGGLADIGSPHVEPGAESLLPCLLAQGARWLRWCGVDRLLTYESDAVGVDRMTALGFEELTRTDRGWEH